MRVRPSVLIVVVAVLAMLFGGRYLGWFGSGTTGRSNERQTLPSLSNETSNAEIIVPGIDPTPLDSKPPAGARIVNTSNRGVPINPPPAVVAAAPITDWEERIDDVLTGAEDENLKAKRLLELFPQLPEDGQVEAAQHLSNLLPDEEYPSLARTLTNAVTPEAVLDVLMTDVLNRPNPLKLGTLLEVARTPNHPKAEEARDVLEVYVDEDFGADWIAWDAAVQKWLKENPEE
jgi:hypothetical protein